jgi:hypothetical protein
MGSNRMSLFQIEQRYFACDHLRQVDLDRLVSAGIPPHSLFQPDCIARARVAFSASGTFDFADEINDETEVGEAFILIARDQFGDVAD